MDVLDRNATVKALADLEPRLREHGVVHLALFGSRARGDHRPDSDIDVVIDIDPARTAKFSLLDLIGVGHVIEDETGLPVHVVARRNLEGRFRRTIEREAIQVF